MSRIVVHVDMDYFYAAVEEREDPSLIGRPVVVCMYSGRGEHGGSVSTSNYTAREYGIKSGMPCSRAVKLNPDAVFLPVRKEFYTEVSDRIMEILRSHADNDESFEQISIDEAFIEVTENCNGDFECARKLGEDIKQKILEMEQLTCSVGVGPNKLIAKMTSSENKPDGLTVISGNEISPFLKDRSPSQLWGVGDVTAGRLEQMGIKTVEQLASSDVVSLTDTFGKKKGSWLKKAAQGIDESPVRQREGSGQIGRIATLPENSSQYDLIMPALNDLADDVIRKTTERDVSFRQITLVVITSDFKTQTRNHTLQRAVAEKEILRSTLDKLLTTFLEENKSVIRRIGVRVAGLQEVSSQTTLASYF
jgi:DNA polymerase IV (DinB-like DNA polymerase)